MQGMFSPIGAVALSERDRFACDALILGTCSLQSPHQCAEERQITSKSALAVLHFNTCMLQQPWFTKSLTAGTTPSPTFTQG